MRGWYKNLRYKGYLLPKKSFCNICAQWIISRLFLNVSIISQFLDYFSISRLFLNFSIISQFLNNINDFNFNLLIRKVTEM